MVLEIKMGKRELTRSMFALESGDNEPKAWQLLRSHLRGSPTGGSESATCCHFWI